MNNLNWFVDSKTSYTKVPKCRGATLGVDRNKDPQMYSIKILHDEWYKDAALKIMGKCLFTIQELMTYLGSLVEKYLMVGGEDISTTHYADWCNDRYDH